MPRQEDSDAGVPITELSCQGENKGEPAQQRQSWSRHLEYMLTMVGFCVALGNILRFPYICNRNGGGAFLIPFILLLCITGFPSFFVEATISQFSGKGAKKVWSFCPLLKGVGVGSLLMNCLYMPYYTLFLAWSIYYMVKSCSSVLPWTTCGNSWNTDLCVEDANTTYNDNNTFMARNTSEAITLKGYRENGTRTPAEEFFRYNVLNVSTGLEDVGAVQWHIVGCLCASYVIIFLCLIRGIKSSGKAVYVTALLPYVLLTSLFITVLQEPGALDGLYHYIIPDFTKLHDIKVWLEACLQVFYSLGVGFGMIGTAASYKNFHASCLKDCLILTIVSEGTSIFSGLVTFATLGFMSQKVDVPIGTVVANGPGLGFVTYPAALAQLPLPQLWSFLFFLMLLMVGLDTQFLAVEVLVTALIDQYPRKLSQWRMLVTGGYCLIVFLLGIIFCTQGGPYMFQLVDWYVFSLGPMVICSLECVAVAWIYGTNRFSRDVETMIGKPLPMILKILLAVITPAILIVTFILTLLRYQPPTYGKYEFPSYAPAIGWFIAVLPLLPIPVYMVITVRKHMATNSVKKSVRLALRPDDEWHPAITRSPQDYGINRQDNKRITTLSSYCCANNEA
ncbi:sodium- and chloride-dependent glycine transporter 1-like [Haliotis asinina]|uniref:sodium- and chloride-dependent glycine transporter 1-like n=1 Tax=Haliotis asinina TaxID=109174 RepID=UPI003531E3EB